MIKSITLKCTLLTLFTLPYTANAGEYKSIKIRTLSSVPKMDKSKSMKSSMLDKISEFVGDDIDLTLFDKKRDGWSVYAKLSKVSRLGLRYNY